jgi:hypothetical protein
MSAWRQKAIDCLPELKQEFESPETSIYDVFIEMRTALVEFHKSDNKERVRKIYDFAEWCFFQKSKDLWNAAGVSFYEHLGDYPETLKEMKRWVKPKIYADIRGLLELRLSLKDMNDLDTAYRWPNTQRK